MSSLAAARCQHIKVNGTQCGSPALRAKKFCFYHQDNRPMRVGCYYPDCEDPLGEIDLPVFEDAHSIQTVIRQIVQMVLQRRLDPKDARLVLYGLRMAASNLQRMEQEKPRPAEVVTDPDHVAENLLEAEPIEAEALPAQAAVLDSPAERAPVNPRHLLGTIQACHQPAPRTQPRERKKPHVGASMHPSIN